jgi:hypothetical protein
MISVLVRGATATALAGTATATHRGGAGEETTAQGRRAGTLRGTRHTTATVHATLLVGLLRHLQHLAELHALVGLHRLLHMCEPRVALSTDVRHLLDGQQKLLEAHRFFNEARRQSIQNPLASIRSRYIRINALFSKYRVGGDKSNCRTIIRYKF